MEEITTFNLAQRTDIILNRQQNRKKERKTKREPGRNIGRNRGRTILTDSSRFFPDDGNAPVSWLNYLFGRMWRILRQEISRQFHSRGFRQTGSPGIVGRFFNIVIIFFFKMATPEMMVDPGGWC